MAENKKVDKGGKVVVTLESGHHLRPLDILATWRYSHYGYYRSITTAGHFPSWPKVDMQIKIHVDPADLRMQLVGPVRHQDPTPLTVWAEGVVDQTRHPVIREPGGNPNEWKHTILEGQTPEAVFEEVFEIM